MISLLLTLTPGSVVMEVSPEGNVLYIHAMDVENERGRDFKSVEKLRESHYGGDPIMIQIMMTTALVFFAIAIGMAVIRIILGPSMPDRVLALDVIGVNLIASIAVISVLMNTKVYLEVILILGILSFIGTIAYSKFIERGVVVERKRDR